MSHIDDNTHDPPTLIHQPRPFKNAEQRQHCWESRDVFYSCLDKNNVERAPEWSRERKEVVAQRHTDKMVCKDEREAFEGSCARDWVGYLNRRRLLELRLRDFDQQAAEKVKKATEGVARRVEE